MKLDLREIRPGQCVTDQGEPVRVTHIGVQTYHDLDDACYAQLMELVEQAQQRQEAVLFDLTLVDSPARQTAVLAGLKERIEDPFYVRMRVANQPPKVYHVIQGTTAWHPVEYRMPLLA